MAELKLLFVEECLDHTSDGQVIEFVRLYFRDANGNVSFKDYTEYQARGLVSHKPGIGGGKDDKS